MSRHLQNEMRRQALLATKGSARPRLGTVTSYDPIAYAIKVAIQPENIETGWLPLKSQWVGNGWGLFTPPPIGGQVEISFQEDHSEAGIGGHGLFSDQDRPLPVQPGECWLVHGSGAAIKLTNDGALTLYGADGQSQIKLPGDGTILSFGAWTHTGSFAASGEVTAMSEGASVALITHQHGLTGGPKTGSPLPE